MTRPFPQRAAGPMAYPASGTLNRLIFKTPLVLWRMGLGPILGQTMLVLTTWGRRSGLPRHSMLSYTPNNGRVYIAAGWGERSDWYQNIQRNPHVTIQHGAGSYSAAARRVADAGEFGAVARRWFQTGGDSHFKPWLESLGIVYEVNDLIAKRERVHMLALDPGDEPGPPPMPADLTWVWGALLASFAAGWVFGRRGRRTLTKQVSLTQSSRRSQGRTQS